MDVGRDASSLRFRGRHDEVPLERGAGHEAGQRPDGEAARQEHEHEPQLERDQVRRQLEGKDHERRRAGDCELGRVEEPDAGDAEDGPPDRPGGREPGDQGDGSDHRPAGDRRCRPCVAGRGRVDEDRRADRADDDGQTDQSALFTLFDAIEQRDGEGQHDDHGHQARSHHSSRRPLPFDRPNDDRYRSRDGQRYGDRRQGRPGPAADQPPPESNEETDPEQVDRDHREVRRRRAQAKDDRHHGDPDRDPVPQASVHAGTVAEAHRPGPSGESRNGVRD